MRSRVRLEYDSGMTKSLNYNASNFGYGKGGNLPDHARYLFRKFLFEASSNSGKYQRYLRLFDNNDMRNIPITPELIEKVRELAHRIN